MGVRRTLYAIICAVDKRYRVMVKSRRQKRNQIGYEILLCVIPEKISDQILRSASY
jgi:hypothetical protein